MTAQLIFANGNGVALASDSAATLRDYAYETNEKIVPLSEPHQLAVVGAGFGHFYKLPIEVMVRQWGRSLGDERLSSVEEYRDRFLSWIALSLDELASPEERDIRALDFFSPKYGYLLRLSEQLNQILEQAERPEGAEEELPGLIETRVLGFLREQNQGAMNVPGSHVISAAKAESQMISAELVEGIFERLWNWVGDDRLGLCSVVEKNLGWLPRSEEIEQEIQTAIKLCIEKSTAFPLGGSGILLSFAGYGSDDLLPEISSVRLGGALGDHVWFRDVPCTYSRDKRLFCRVHSQAQDDQIMQFLTGLGLPDQIGWNLMEHSRHKVHAAWDKLDYSQRTRERMSRAYDDAVGSLIEEAMKWGREESLGKAMVAFANMPLDELANVARSLIDLQKMKKTVMADFPNVGGPIMVATITLHEGFQWATPSEPAT
tara:strand:+ start:477 stop:1769 length:1293 start_codon:yes stop_codon:yes gene_type:complete